jgi:hypothetical protein
MTNNRSIQFTATFLLIVFALNTLVGFACSMGLDMGFNTSHHSNEAIELSGHIHANGKKHHHPADPIKSNAHIHIHGDGKKHGHHTEPVTQHHEEKENQGKSEDDCCKDEVLKFHSLDKNLNQNVRNEINAPALVAILNTFLGIDINIISAEPQLYTSRYLFPPPPDIRLSIHRFQI